MQEKAFNLNEFNSTWPEDIDHKVLQELALEPQATTSVVTDNW